MTFFGRGIIGLAAQRGMLLGLTAWLWGCVALFGAQGGPVGGAVFETAGFVYRIGARGENLAFVDRTTKRDWLRRDAPGTCASIRQGGKEISVSAARLEGGQLILGFADTGVSVRLRTTVHREHVVWQVDSIEGGEPEVLTFLNVPLSLPGRPADSFGACALSMNLQTRVDALPALQTVLRASCEKKFGQLGARVAMVAAPMRQFRPALQKALETSSELPVCRVAGPWAAEVPFCHGSYLFNFGSLTETNLDEWIETTRSLGFNQIDNHGGGNFFRFGDFELNREKWPEGWDTWKRMVGRLHEQGIGSIFHTYAFFIDKRSKYVTPVPDRRLDAFRTLTLRQAVSAEAEELEVEESTAGMNTTTGFFVHNSVVLQLEDELVTFGAVSGERPGRFTQLKRGALGTRAAAHPAGTKARHLKECFGLFVPDVESTLFDEIAANHAEVVNRCGFDGIYLDAIDGSAILRGGEDAWYWASRFVTEIQKRLQRPAGMEMSSMWHHFWQYRTRWQAWDYPQRGQVRFIDQHARDVHGGLLLPLHLGWWNFQAFQPPQVEPSYPEVMATVGARLIGWDAGISLTGGADRKALRDTPLFRRAAETLRWCETTRQSHALRPAVLARLREPGQEFLLLPEKRGGLRFHPVQPVRHVVDRNDPASLAWVATNSFPRQPLRLRIEALMGVELPPAAASTDLLHLPGDPAWQGRTNQAEGVSLQFRAMAAEAGEGWTFHVRNQGRTAQTSAWARVERRLATPIDLHGQQGLSLEVEADGAGALLAIRMESPEHLAYGAVADRYVPLDFQGRRRLTLVESESSRWSDYQWGDGKGLYHVYRESIDFGKVETITVGLQNIPAGPGYAGVRVKSLRAVPLRPAKIRQLRITLNGQEVRWPVELISGQWIEMDEFGQGRRYGPKGEELGPVAIEGHWPQLQAGQNQVSVDCLTEAGPAPRFRITLLPVGKAL